MTTVVENSWGWILNQKVAIEKLYQDVRDGDKRKTYRCREELFAVTRPHITVDYRGCDGDVHTEEDAVTMGTSVNQDQTQEESDHRKTKKRKRKQQTDLNAGEAAAMEYHKQIKPNLLLAYTSFQTLWRGSELFQDCPTDEVPVGKPWLDWGPGNCLSDLCDLARITENQEPLILSKETSSEETDIFNRLVHVETDHSTVTSMLGGRYLLPARSSFLMSDISRIQPLVQGGTKFNFIVMDPPWENKSVKRAKRYASLSPRQLFQLPIPSLAAPGCLVVTWVTNRCQHMRFVREDLYPHWSVETVAEWHWLKVTRTGELVFPMDSPHKKPYETIILGRFVDQSGGLANSRSPVVPDVPKHKVICSVPCVLHSRKPPLDEVLQKYLPPTPICLELFARCLQPGWTSWGNEVRTCLSQVIKFQHLDFYQEERATHDPE